MKYLETAIEGVSVIGWLHYVRDCKTFDTRSFKQSI